MPFIVYLLFVPTNAYIYIYIYIYITILNYTTNAPTCFGALHRHQGALILHLLNLLKLHKTVGRCMVKSVLLIKWGSGSIISDSKVLSWCLVR